MKNTYYDLTMFRKIFIFSIFAFVFVSVLALAACSQSQSSDSSQASSEPIVGQWQTLQQVDNEEAQVIFSVNADGTAYWMTLGNKPGFQISSLILDSWKDTWEKDGNKTYNFVGSTGEYYQYSYDKETDTMISPSGNHLYTRLDPLVGIWAGEASDKVAFGKTTTMVKPDGTGIVTVAYDNGVASLYSLTWAKTSDDQYILNFSDGASRSYTIDNNGNILTSEDDSIKTKSFTDSSYLVSVTGIWYNPENNYSSVFNADGTGFWNNRGQVNNFTWKVSAVGEFEVTYKDGIGLDGSDLTGKSYTWYYDRTDHSFTTPNFGSKYVRPTAEVPGLIYYNQ